MKIHSLNKVFIPLFVFNFAVLMTLFYFYYRDVVAAKEPGSEGCAPYGVSIDDIGKNYVELSWKTHSICSSYLKVGLYSDDINETVVGENGYAAAKDHKALIENLRPGSTYYVTFFSNGELYGDRGQPFEIKTEAF